LRHVEAFRLDLDRERKNSASAFAEDPKRLARKAKRRVRDAPSGGKALQQHMGLKRRHRLANALQRLDEEPVVVRFRRVGVKIVVRSLETLIEGGQIGPHRFCRERVLDRGGCGGARGQDKGEEESEQIAHARQLRWSTR
jgi:hypothetical protein